MATSYNARLIQIDELSMETTSFANGEELPW